MADGAGAIVVSSTPSAGGAAAEAAAIAVALALEGSAGEALLVDLVGGRSWRPTVLAAAGARALAASFLEDELDSEAVARGRICIVAPPHGGAGSGTELVAAQSGGLWAPAVVHAPASIFRELLELGLCRAALIRTGGHSDGPLTAALAIELRKRRVPIKAWSRGLGPLASRRALAGLDPGGEAGRRARRLVALSDRPVSPRSARRPLADPRRRLGAEAGQALPAMLGLIVAVAFAAFALVAVGGGVTAKGRAQRAADLAALSAGRSMRDDFPRLFEPARLAGRPNPRHLERSEYLRRASAAARQAASKNGLPGASVSVGFPDRSSFAPLRVEVVARPRLRVGTSANRGRITVAATAVAEPVAASAAASATASGGGYAGPLAYRQGKPMRPDVAAAFDRLERAATTTGLALTINSAFRSDAEQAALFAANPDPRWVAPPGRSLHRCGTELDLGPPSAYGWLDANAGRFGFDRRYSWEPWHFGFVRGPAPCSAAADAGSGSRPGGGGGDGRGAGGGGLPAYVPAFIRGPLLEAAARHDVSAALLAAQLMAESNFNPAAVSAAGAQGIAQFMPATAAAYGLEDPFDAAASVEAQARLMADLLRRFGSTELALAAYNAGPGAVAACGCAAPYPETAAYVARILGLLGGAGAGQTASPATLEVRLIA